MSFSEINIGTSPSWRGHEGRCPFRGSKQGGYTMLTLRTDVPGTRPFRYMSGYICGLLLNIKV